MQKDKANSQKLKELRKQSEEALAEQVCFIRKYDKLRFCRIGKNEVPSSTTPPDS